MWIALSYLFGSIPFGLLLTKLVRGKDLRQVGSGNIGATNTARAVGLWGGILVYLLDFAKGYLPASVPQLFQIKGAEFFTLGAIFGTAAILGHCFSVFLKFKGGKGVSTLTGVLIALDPTALLLAGGIWFVTLCLFRFVSLASILLSLSLPAIVYLKNPDAALSDRLPLLVFTILIAAFIIYTHRSNLKRILEGNESRVRFLSKEKEGTRA